MTEQIAWNKSSLPLKIILENSPKLQLFTINIKKGIIYKSRADRFGLRVLEFY